MATMHGVVFTGPMKTIPRLRLAPTHSLWVVAGCAVMGMASAGLMWMLPMPGWMMTYVLGCCVAMTSVAIHSALHRVPSLLVLGADRRVAVTDPTGVAREGDVRDATYVGGWVVALVWRADGARWSSAWLIPPGVLTADERRQMRVLLRYGRPAGGDDAATTSRASGSRDVVAG